MSANSSHRITRAAVHHRPKNHFAYGYNSETVHLRIQTKKGDVRSINVLFKDPFGWDHRPDCTPMSYKGSSELFDYWQAEVSPPTKRLEYMFELQGEHERVYYTEKGFFSDYHASFGWFKFPFLNQADIFSPPAWVKDTVWYQIFPERFANGDITLNPPHTEPWGASEPSPSNFFGGDLEGIIQHLDYLSDLGITGIYLTPVFEATSNHKYDTIDYLKIDPHFGDTQKLKELVQRCHERGIRVMLDAVFNHCGFYFGPFQDVLKHGEQSKYKDWFHLHGFPVQTEPHPNYDTFAFTHMMPKFNTENEEVKQYLLQVARHWIEECDIDGWRLDVANEVDHVFWREFRKVVKETKRDVYILGEVWNDAMPWLQGEQFDAVMNYPFTDLTMNYFARNYISLEQYKHGIHELLFMYPEQVHSVAFNLLGSHDTARIYQQCGDDRRKMKLLFLALLTFSGSPCIYYGDEIGMTGSHDPGCRKCMVWDYDMHDRSLHSFVKSLISLRKNHPALSEGSFVFHERNDVLIYEKRHETETFYILVNNQPVEGTVSFVHDHLQLVSIKGISHEGKSFSLNPYGYAILRTPSA